MSVKYSDIEEAIKAKLDAEAWANTDIITAPERAKGLTPPVPKITLIVQYAGSKFGPLMTTNPMSQEETGSFNVIAWSKKLRGETGVYDALQKIRVSLLGFEPAGCQRLMLAPDKGIEFVEFNDDLWQFAITFSTTWLAVQDVPTEEEILITELNLKDV